MTTKLIQLREADDMSKQDAAVGGNFSAVLQEPLYLEKGDSIRMKSAFLSDITANQNTVVFPQELTVTFYIARYYRDWGSYEVVSNYNTRVSGGIGGNRQHFSNKDFVLCESTTAASTQNVQSLSLRVNTDLLKSIKFEHMDFSIGYFAPSSEQGGKQTAYINFRASRKELARRIVEGSGDDKGKSVIILDNSFSTESGKLGFPRIAILDTFQGGPQFTLFKSETEFGRKRKRNHIFTGLRIAESTAGNADGESTIFYPWRRPLTIKIPKNTKGYMPEELTSIINEQVQAVVTNEQNEYPTSQGINNPLIGTRNDAALILGSNPYFISTEGTEYRQLTANQWIGSNAFAIIYRDDLQKYQIAQTHLPIYSAQSDGILQLQRTNEAYNDGGAVGINYTANKAGGIIIESTDPPDFLQSYFSFKPDIFGTFTKSDKVTMSNKAGDPVSGFADAIVPKIDLIEGVNVTGHYVNLDSLINKSGTSFETPTLNLRLDIPTPPTANAITQAFIAETQMHSIIGETVSNVQSGEGYYQIEISMPVNSDIRGQDNKNNKIQGIVGRYYSKDSYTSSVEGEGSIPYFHESDDPLILNSFKVRILTPEGEQMEGLQNDNTIFLEVIKNNKSI